MTSGRHDFAVLLAIVAAIIAIYGLTPRTKPGGLPNCSSLGLPWRLLRPCVQLDDEPGVAARVHELNKIQSR